MPPNDNKFYSRLAHRKQLEAKEGYLVDPLLPAGAFHMLGGPSGIGKTTWLMQQLYDWSQGKEVLGYPSHPCDWVYISCDRSTDDTNRTLRRMGLEDRDIPAYSVEEIMPRNASTGQLEGEPSLHVVVARFPDVKLIVLEGIQAFIGDPPRGQSQNKHEMIWMMQIRDTLCSKGISIIAVTHSPKGTDGYTGARSRFLGSASFLGMCGTLIHFDVTNEFRQAQAKAPTNVDNGNRLVNITGPNIPDMHLSYSRDEVGRFVLDACNGAIKTTDMDRQWRFSTWLSMRPSEQLIPASELRSWGKKNGVSDSTFSRWIQQRMQDGQLRKTDGSHYQVLRIFQPN